MMKKSALKLLALGVPVVGIFAWMCGRQGSTNCSQSNFIAPDGSPIAVTLDYSACSRTDGCEFVMQCENKGKLKAALSSFNNASKDIFSDIFTAYADEAENEFTFALSILNLETLDKPAILQIAPGVVENQNWYNSERALPCKDEGDSIRCVTFAPISDRMLLQGTMSGRPVKLDITVDTSASDAQKASPGQIKTCGQLGVNSTLSRASDFSTLQRMYDCSKQVSDFGGYSNADGGVVPFTLGASVPTSSWFLVGCPSDNIADKEKCSWLSPVLASSIKFLDNPLEYLPSDEEGNLGDKISVLKGKRILVSGVLSQKYNFFEVNGKRNKYDNYPYVNGGVSYSDYCEKSSNATEGTLRPCYIGSLDLKRCQSSASAPWPKCQKFVLTEEQQKAYDAVQNAQNICASLKNTDSSLISNYDWMVPNYPLFLLMSGGNVKANSPNAQSCDREDGIDPVGIRPSDVCLGGPQIPSVNYHGLRAFGKIPGFQEGFIGSNGGLQMLENYLTLSALNEYGVVGFIGLIEKYNVRCMALDSE